MLGQKRQPLTPDKRQVPAESAPFPVSAGVFVPLAAAGEVGVKPLVSHGRVGNGHVPFGLGAHEAEIQTKEGSLVDKILVDKRTGWMRSIY